MKVRSIVFVAILVLLYIHEDMFLPHSSQQTQALCDTDSDCEEKFGPMDESWEDDQFLKGTEA